MSPDLAGFRLLVLSDAARTGPAERLATAARATGAYVDAVHPGPHREAGLRALVAAHDLVHVVTGGARAHSWLFAGLVGLAARASRTHAAVTLHDEACPQHLVTPARALAARAALAPFDEVIGATDEIALVLRRIGARVDRLSVARLAGRADEPGHALLVYQRYVPDSHPTT